MADPRAGGRIGGDLRVRAISAAVLAALTLLAAWAGGWVAALLVAVATVIVYGEWAGLTARDVDIRALLAPGVLVGAAVLLVGWSPVWAAAVLAVAIAAAAWAQRRAWLPAGVVYAAAFGIGLLVLRGDPDDGLAALLFLFAVVWGADTGAYFAGRLLGGPKLWPRVSPKKTWSGFFGGLATGTVAGLAVAAAFRNPPTAGLAVVAVALAAISVAGDLFESWIKRRAGAKDASRLIPGHGGLMDRVDGLIFAAALAAIIGVARSGMGDVGGGLLRW